MVDIATIKDNYKKMEDFQLQQIAKEGSQLTMDGFIILKREIIKRGLDTTIISEQEALRVEQKIDRINSNIETESKKFVRKTWNLALLKKSEGFTDDEIIQILVARGTDPGSALALTANLDYIANELLKDAENGIVGGVIWLALGIAGAFAGKSLNLSTSFIIYFITIMSIRGIILLYISSADKSKLKDIIYNIESEKEAGK